MEIIFRRVDGICSIAVDGHNLDGVTDYKVSTSADGITEAEIKLEFKSSIINSEMSTT